MTNILNSSKILSCVTKGENKMEDVILEKALFISKNKDKIINNITKVSYPLFKILASDEALKDIEDYDKVVEMLKNIETEILISNDTRDEKYIMETILAFVNKVTVDYEEREAARNSLNRYDKFFERKKVKIKVQNA